MFEWKPNLVRFTKLLENGFYERTSYVRLDTGKYRVWVHFSETGTDLSLWEVSYKEMLDAWDRAEGDDSITVQCD